MLDERERKIRAKAYELWEAAGRPAGREKEHWAEAERIVDSDEASKATEPAKPRAPRRNRADSGNATKTKSRPSRKLDRT